MNKTEPIFVRNNSVCLKICVRLIKHRICVRLTENRPLDYAEIKKTRVYLIKAEVVICNISPFLYLQMERVWIVSTAESINSSSH